MSMHYYQITTVNIENLSDKARKELIAKLKKRDPKLARKLEKIDWNAVTAQVAKEALQQVAQEEGLTFNASYDNWSNYYSRSEATRVEGKELGAIGDKDKTQLGVSMKPDGGIAFFFNRYSQERGHDRLERWQAKFREAYRVRAHVAMLKILGRDVTVEKAENGAYVIKAKVEVK